MRSRRLLAAVLVAAIAAACRRPASEKQPVVIETSRVFASTGLPQQLARAFTAETHVRTDLRIVDASQLAALQKNTVPDVAIVGPPGLKAVLSVAGPERLVHTFAYDDFFLVGPKRDAARIAAASSAVDAFRRIVKHRQPFCSPADDPVLHERETLIWSETAVDPHTNRRYGDCRGNPLSVLRESSARAAYTLTDRSSFEIARDHDLRIVRRDDPALHNDYTVVLLAPPQKNRNAEWFVQWLMSYRGRDLVDNYRFDGGRRFYVSEER